MEYYIIFAIVKSLTEEGPEEVTLYGIFLVLNALDSVRPYKNLTRHYQ